MAQLVSRASLSPAAIQFQGVTKVFKGRPEICALKDLSFQVGGGELFSIIGPSGCGKTTLINLAAGFLRPTRGSVLVNGVECEGPGPDRGVIFQDYGLFDWRTVRGNVEFGLKARGIPKRERREVARRYIDLVNLSGCEQRYPCELSGGMKQRVALARTLAVDPACILMDEPFGSLDSLLRATLQEELLRIWRETGKTIVHVTHDIDEAIYLSDRVMVMSGNAGSVRVIMDVGFERPRKPELKMTPEFGELRRRLWSELHP